MIECKSNIAVLLATYKGEKYIAEQLKSLANQTYKDFEVFIHDDQSPDMTLDVIRNFDSKDMRITILEDDVNRGACGSFMWLLENVEADYYMFCDQDDYWLPSKIEVSINALQHLEQEFGKDEICMVSSDLTIVDQYLNPIHNSMFELRHMDPVLNCKIGPLTCIGFFTGCTMIFNKTLKQRVFPYPRDCWFHDMWVGLVASKFGHVKCLPFPTILYRQHDENVVGAQTDIKKRTVKAGLRGFLWHYNSQRSLFEAVGISKFQAFLYKVIYTLQLRKILPGYHPHKYKSIE